MERVAKLLLSRKDSLTLCLRPCAQNESKIFRLLIINKITGFDFERSEKSHVLAVQFWLSISKTPQARGPQAWGHASVGTQPYNRQNNQLGYRFAESGLQIVLYPTISHRFEENCGFLPIINP
jgi:hypothetical protein